MAKSATATRTITSKEFPVPSAAKTCCPPKASIIKLAIETNRFFDKDLLLFISIYICILSLSPESAETQYSTCKDDNKISFFENMIHIFDVTSCLFPILSHFIFFFRNPKQLLIQIRHFRISIISAHHTSAITITYRCIPITLFI